MDADIGEVGAEAVLHVGAGGLVEGPSGGAQDGMDGGALHRGRGVRGLPVVEATTVPWSPPVVEESGPAHHLNDGGVAGRSLQSEESLIRGQPRGGR
ncbi:hypothetical protein ACGF0D_09830 [Kitasatospora sp. NPDC048298]|uniref:hypothetical protein n=1 Tax=Kitasatospora sp. NPDC048298 TaxID=3364049 RepID=UPI0037136FA2